MINYLSVQLRDELRKEVMLFPNMQLRIALMGMSLDFGDSHMTFSSTRKVYETFLVQYFPYSFFQFNKSQKRFLLSQTCGTKTSPWFLVSRLTVWCTNMLGSLGIDQDPVSGYGPGQKWRFLACPVSSKNAAGNRKCKMQTFTERFLCVLREEIQMFALNEY